MMYSYSGILYNNEIKNIKQWAMQMNLTNTILKEEYVLYGFIYISSKTWKTIAEEVKIVVTFGMVMADTKRQGGFWGAGNILHFILGGGYSTVFAL